MYRTYKASNQISLETILGATTLTRLASESTEIYLQRVTHLHLQGKRIQKLENLDFCLNLKVLYLYDNLIEKIENLDSTLSLQYLQLQNNAITEIPPLNMPSLTKLYLDDNRIRLCSGLDRCGRLEELHIANQSLPDNISLQFDSTSIAAISRTLMVLEISNTGIEYLAPFMMLQSLRKLLCSNNKIRGEEEIREMVALRYLSEADFRGNPCCSLKRYRDNTISASSDALELLDEIPVLRCHKIAMKGLTNHRKKVNGTGVFSLSNFGDDQKIDHSASKTLNSLGNSGNMVAGGTAIRRGS